MKYVVVRRPKLVLIHTEVTELPKEIQTCYKNLVILW